MLKPKLTILPLALTSHNYTRVKLKTTASSLYCISSIFFLKLNRGYFLQSKTTLVDYLTPH